jgi:hypothetical protein
MTSARVEHLLYVLLLLLLLLSGTVGLAAASGNWQNTASFAAAGP